MGEQVQGDRRRRKKWENGRGGCSGWKGASWAFPNCKFEGPRIEEEGGQEGSTERMGSEKPFVKKEWVQGKSKGVEGDEGKEGRERTGKKRGRRRRGFEVVEIWTANTSGRPQLEKTIREATRAGEEKRKVVAILNQEHQQGQGKVQDLQHWSKEMGWSMAASKATSTDKGGWSAGTAVVTPRNVHAGVKEGIRVDMSTENSKGRIAQTWLMHVVPCGVMVSAVYLWHTERGTQRNTELLGRALRGMVESGCPWIMGMDANDTPRGLEEWAGGMIEKAGGRIVCQKEATHYPAVGAARNIDFFIVSEALTSAIKGVSIVEEVSLAPHRAVSVKLGCMKERLLQWSLRTPKAFPRAKPIGCGRCPVVPSKEAITGWAEQRGQKERERGLEEAWGNLVGAIELEMCGVSDSYCDGLPDGKHLGREEGPKHAQTQVLPPRAAGKYGEVDPVMHAMLWAKIRITVLVHLSDITVGCIEGEGEMTEGQQRQWGDLVRKCLEKKGSPIKQALSKESRWKEVAG